MKQVERLLWVRELPIRQPPRVSVTRKALIRSGVKVRWLFAYVRGLRASRKLDVNETERDETSLRHLMTRMSERVRHRVDRLFGYDVFIAHRRADAASYAARLAEALLQRQLATFIDVREYGPGDELSGATLRHIRRATLLVVLGSPAIIEPRDPDWVLAEIEAYWATHDGDERRVLPIDFGGSLASGPDAAPIAHRLRHVIRLDEPLAALGEEPSASAIDAIARQFRNRRRESVRLRVFQGIAAMLAVLALAAGGAAWTAQRALAQARRNLAANYVTAAQDRLAQGFADEAAALAGQSLRHADSPEARALVVENPPLDLSDVRIVPAPHPFALASDGVARVAMAGYQGRVQVVDIRQPGLPAPAVSRAGTRDLESVTFAPAGDRLVVGDQDGRLQVLALPGLAPVPCQASPRLARHVELLRFLPGGDTLLAVADGKLWRVAVAGGCPAGEPQQVYDSEKRIVDLAVDVSHGRVVVGEVDAIIVLPLAPDGAAPAVRHVLPSVDGRIEPAELDRLAVQPGTGVVAALLHGRGRVWLFDPEDFAKPPDSFQPFGAVSDYGGVGTLEFTADGRWLVVAENWGGRLTVWSMTRRRADRRLRLPGMPLLALVDRVALAVEPGISSPATARLRRIPLDPPGRRFVSWPGGAMPAWVTLEEHPPGTRVLAGTYEGQLLAVDPATARAVPFAKASRYVRWVGTAPDGTTVGYVADGAVAGLVRADGTRLRQETLAASGGEITAHTWIDGGASLLVANVGDTALRIPLAASSPAVPAAPLPQSGAAPPMGSANQRRTAGRTRFSVIVRDAAVRRAELPWPVEVGPVSMTGDGQWLIGGAGDLCCWTWSLRALDAPAAEVADEVERLAGKVDSAFGVTAPGAENKGPSQP